MQAMDMRCNAVNVLLILLLIQFWVTPLTHSVNIVVQLAITPNLNSESGWNGQPDATLFARA